MEHESSVPLGLQKKDPRTQHDLSELRTRDQPPTDRLSAADLQLKRRREFEDQFNGEEKKIKLDDIILPVQEETSHNEVDTTAMVQALLYINMLQIIMQTINLMREPVSTEFPSVLPHPISNDNVNYRITPCTSIKTESTNTLTTANSLAETSTPSSKVSGPFGTQVSECIIIKQEPTDQEHISPNVSNTDHQSVSPANDESPDVEICPYGTRVSKKDLAKINGMEVSIATRTLLTLVFDRQTLATHTLSGKPSKRFLKSNGSLKPKLNPLKVADITYYEKRVFNCTEPDIRHTIAIKCAEIGRTFTRRNLSKASFD